MELIIKIINTIILALLVLVQTITSVQLKPNDPNLFHSFTNWTWAGLILGGLGLLFGIWQIIYEAKKTPDERPILEIDPNRGSNPVLTKTIDEVNGYNMEMFLVSANEHPIKIIKWRWFIVMQNDKAIYSLIKTTDWDYMQNVPTMINQKNALRLNQSFTLPSMDLPSSKLYLIPDIIYQNRFGKHESYLRKVFSVSSEVLGKKMNEEINKIFSDIAPLLP